MKAIVDIVQSISVILACWTAIWGIDAWRREFIGKRRIKLAEEALEAFFTVRDAISFIRNPCSNINEGKTRKRGENETDEEAELLNRAYVVIERYQTKMDVFSRFASIKYRFMVAFGNDTEHIFKQTQGTLYKIFMAAEQLGKHYWQRQGRVQMSEDERKKHLEEMFKKEEIFWESNSPDDEIKKDLANILAELEKVTAPAFRNESALYRILTRRLLGK